MPHQPTGLHGQGKQEGRSRAHREILQRHVSFISVIPALYHILLLHRPSRRGTYFLKFVFCEILNFINVIGQIYLTDLFLGYQFTKFGRDVFAQSEMDLNTREDPMHRVFPKVAKCRFNKYGPSGSIQTHDALCVLPINIINEKIYIFLYFWFVFLGAISAMWLLYRFLTIVSQSLRVSIIFYRSDKQVPKPLIEAAISNPKHSTLERLGDYLLLYFITKNVNPLIIKVLLPQK